MNASIKALLASYGRSVLAGASALYMAGVTDPKDLAYSLIAALAPVALRYVNPNDKAFGRLPSVEEVAEAAKKAVAKKAPVKKSAPKKK
jgi:nucleoside-diphosphate-sugar epimerase